MQQEGEAAIDRLQASFKKFDAILEAKDKQAIPRMPLCSVPLAYKLIAASVEHCWQK